MATKTYGSVVPGGSTSSTSFSRTIEKVFEEAQHTGDLNLSGRNLTVYPKIATKYDLTDTISADLSKNRLADIPAEVYEYTSLERLNTYHNVVKFIPDAILQLSALTHLNLSRNLLCNIPPFICKLQALEVIIACNNKLVSLPEELGRLEKLMELDVSCNNVSHLPSQLGNLSSLRILNVRRNLLVELPIDLCRLNLRCLDVSENRITMIPPAFRKMESLEEIRLNHNPLTLPPAHVCKKGRVHVMKYLHIESVREDTRRGALSETDMRRLVRKSLSQQALSADEIKNMVDLNESAWKRHTVGGDSGYSTTDSNEKCNLSPMEVISDDVDALALKAAEVARDQRHARDAEVVVMRRAPGEHPVRKKPVESSSQHAVSNTTPPTLASYYQSLQKLQPQLESGGSPHAGANRYDRSSASPVAVRFPSPLNKQNVYHSHSYPSVNNIPYADESDYDANKVGPSLRESPQLFNNQTPVDHGQLNNHSPASYVEQTQRGHLNRPHSAVLSHNQIPYKHHSASSLQQSLYPHDSIPNYPSPPLPPGLHDPRRPCPTPPLPPHAGISPPIANAASKPSTSYSNAQSISVNIAPSSSNQFSHVSPHSRDYDSRIGPHSTAVHNQQSVNVPQSRAAARTSLSPNISQKSSHPIITHSGPYAALHTPVGAAHSPRYIYDTIPESPPILNGSDGSLTPSDRRSSQSSVDSQTSPVIRSASQDRAPPLTNGSRSASPLVCGGQQVQHVNHSPAATAASPQKRSVTPQASVCRTPSASSISSPPVTPESRPDGSVEQSTPFSRSLHNSELQRQKADYDRRKKLAEQLRIQQEAEDKSRKEEEEKDERRRAALRLQEEQQRLLQEQKRQRDEEERQRLEAERLEKEEIKRLEEAAKRRLAEEEEKLKQAEKLRAEALRQEEMRQKEEIRQKEAAAAALVERMEIPVQNVSSVSVASPAKPTASKPTRKTSTSSVREERTRQLGGATQSQYRRTTSDSTTRIQTPNGSLSKLQKAGKNKEAGSPTGSVSSLKSDSSRTSGGPSRGSTGATRRVPIEDRRAVANQGGAKRGGKTPTTPTAARVIPPPSQTVRTLSPKSALPSQNNATSKTAAQSNPTKPEAVSLRQRFEDAKSRSKPPTSVSSSLAKVNHEGGSQSMPTVNGVSAVRNKTASTASISSLSSGTSREPDNNNFTLRRQQLLATSEAEQIDKLRKTIESRLKISLSDNVQEDLRNGVALCHLANQIRPRSVPSIHVPSPAVKTLTAAKCRKNVENFVEACRKIGVTQDHLCSWDDVVYGLRPARVTKTVLALTALPRLSSKDYVAANLSLFILVAVVVGMLVYSHAIVAL